MDSVPTLFTKNRRLAFALARTRNWPGAEQQDVDQEAMIGLWSAARDYRADAGTKFSTFATVVIRRRLDSCVKAATRGKHQPLNEALRSLGEGGEAVDAVALLPCLHQVTDFVEERERLAAVLAAIADDLTEYERHCVLGVAAGLPYERIGNPKQVDNALYRARRKLRAAA